MCPKAQEDEGSWLCTSTHCPKAAFRKNKRANGMAGRQTETHVIVCYYGDVQTII